MTNNNNDKKQNTLNKLTKNGVAIGDIFLDETGMFDVDPIEYYNISLSKIETALSIKHIKHAINPENAETKTFDTWLEVKNFIDELKQINKDPSFYTAILGYELVYDNHYIKLYYRHRPLFS